jgi:glycopeptide antibiotics resistance protein
MPMGLWIVAHGLRRKLRPLTLLLQLVVLVHVMAVIASAFFPFPYQRELIDVFRAHQVAHNNLVPLVSLIHAIGTGTNPSVVHQSIGNFLMLLPLGLYLPLLVPRARHVAATVLVGLGVSLAVEFGQLAISAILGYTYKIADVDDVILNTAGVAVGYGIYRVGRQWLIRSRANLAGTLDP